MSFLHGELQEITFMQQPLGFIFSNPNQVCKLHKVIYDLKQISCLGLKKLSITLIQMEFSSTKSDPSLFT